MLSFSALADTANLEDLEKFIDQPDKSKYQYASEVAYIYLKWVTIGWEDYINDADPDEVWDEYMSNIDFDQFSDYCEEFDDFLDEHDDERPDVYSQAEEVVIEVVPKIYYTINRKHITIPEF